jgi:hypothetical protein
MIYKQQSCLKLRKFMVLKKLQIGFCCTIDNVNLKSKKGWGVKGEGLGAGRQWQCIEHHY